MKNSMENPHSFINPQRCSYGRTKQNGVRNKQSTQVESFELFNLELDYVKAYVKMLF
jgi:hypothetical protein